MHTRWNVHTLDSFCKQAFCFGSTVAVYECLCNMPIVLV